MTGGCHLSIDALRPADLVTRTIGLDGIGAALATMDQPGSDGITVAVP